MTEYTNEDMRGAWEKGFEAGVNYVFSHIPGCSLTYSEAWRFADWLTLKCPWRSRDAWLEDIWALIGGDE